MESEIFKCTACGREFELAYQLEIHTRGFHQTTTNYKCEKCGQEFGLKEQLDTHTAFYTHSDNEKASDRTASAEQSRKLY